MEIERAARSAAEGSLKELKRRARVWKKRWRTHQHAKCTITLELIGFYTEDLINFHLWQLLSKWSDLGM